MSASATLLAEPAARCRTVVERVNGLVAPLAAH